MADRIPGTARMACPGCGREALMLSCADPDQLCAGCAQPGKQVRGQVMRRRATHTPSGTHTHEGTMPLIDNPRG